MPAAVTLRPDSVTRRSIGDDAVFQIRAFGSSRAAVMVATVMMRAVCRLGLWLFPFRLAVDV
jgi:hypothetical protein